MTAPTPRRGRESEPLSVRMPADVERPERLLAGLTGRQLVIVAAAVFTVWLGWRAAGRAVPVAVFAALAVPVLVIAAGLVVGHRDGLSGDQLVTTAVRQLLAPRRQVPAPGGITPPPAWAGPGAGRQGWVPGKGPLVPGVLRLPARAVRPDGVVDLGREGAALLCQVSPVNLALRTPGEQQALIGAFGRWCNSLTAPVQVVVSTARLDLRPAAEAIDAAAGGLPHPALEAAAHAHAGFLRELGESRTLLARRVVLVLREPPRPGTRTLRDLDGAAGRLHTRAGQAASALAAAGLTVGVLDGPAATAALATAADPSRPTFPAAGAAGGEPVTGTAVTGPAGPVTTAGPARFTDSEVTW